MPEEFKYQKDAHAEVDNGRRWQDEINSGFDRLVAYATEVDKRRRSTDSNSPVRPNSNLSNNDDNIQFHEKTNNTPPNNTKNKAKIDANMDDVFLNNQQQQQQVQQFHEKTTNNSMMKFKSNNVYSGPRGVVSANSPYARAMPVHSNKISHVPS